MKYTPNYNLKKPGDEDNVLVGDLNDNMDTLDEKLKEAVDDLGRTSDSLEAHIQDKDNPHEVTVKQIGAATVGDPIILTFPASGWALQSNKTFTQSIACAGLKTTDNYRSRVEPVGNSSDPGAQELTDAAYACINYAACNEDGFLFLRCKTKPKVNFNVAVVIIR